MNRRGFSLFEMIVVLGIMSIATGIGASVFIQMGDNWRAVRRISDLEAQAQAAFDAIRADAENLLAPRLTGVVIRSESPNYSNPREFRRGADTNLIDGKLWLPVYAAIGPGQTVTAAKASYRIDRSEPMPRLVRSLSGLYSNEVQGPGTTIAEGVYAFAVDFPGAAEGDTSPPLMRISLLMADESRPDQQIARTALVPLRVE